MHRLSLEQRNGLKITGVLNVDSFDQGNVIMETEEGILNIKGEGLHVSRLVLDKGEADVEGRVSALSYSETKTLTKKGEGLMKRLFS
jgi:sporulation protein YabP